METTNNEEFIEEIVSKNYLANISSVISHLTIDDSSPSQRVIKALQKIYPKTSTVKFKQKVLDAILEDACEGKSAEWRKKYRRRLKRWTGSNHLNNFYERFEILASWKQRYRIVPDAYFIDAENKTVVCFEVEDQHHLTPNKIEHYGGAWNCLEYIYWDLHLISYDIYGNPRLIELPDSSYTASHLLDSREIRNNLRSKGNIRRSS